MLAMHACLLTCSHQHLAAEQHLTLSGRNIEGDDEEASLL